MVNLKNLLEAEKSRKSRAEEYEELDLSEFEEGFKNRAHEHAGARAELNGLDIMPRT